MLTLFYVFIYLYFTNNYIRNIINLCGHTSYHIIILLTILPLLYVHLLIVKTNSFFYKVSLIKNK